MGSYHPLPLFVLVTAPEPAHPTHTIHVAVAPTYPAHTENVLVSKGGRGAPVPGTLVLAADEQTSLSGLDFRDEEGAGLGLWAAPRGRVAMEDLVGSSGSL